jgi:NAD(P)-dependent dehydrogenase (short-subunit alcohol dehydrogenase family)
VGFRLDGRVAVVTGAAGGIGSACCRLFAELGASVVAADVDRAGLDRLATELGPPHAGVPTDLASEADCTRLIEASEARHGRLDILVNAGAVMIRKDIPDFTADDWRLTFDVNARSVFLLTRAATAIMRRAGWGRVVIVSSSSAHTGGLFQSSVYAMSKGALLTMTRSFARRLAADGVLVNAVAPGPCDTAMFRLGLSDEDVESYRQSLPIKRVAAPIEMARAIAFLCSDWSSYLTGQVINVDGGQIMR